MSRLLRNFFVFTFYLLLAACSTPGPGLFKKQTPHEAYAERLNEAGLQGSALGRAWFGAADRALRQPVTVQLPYTVVGYFPADRPDALGLRFTAQRGQKVALRIEKRPANGFRLYADLWEEVPNGQPRFVQSADSASMNMEVEIEGETHYILRLQPELLSSGDYTVRISVGPSLGFPVAGRSGRVGSVWGDARDGGARSHEGIDIFAPKRTPVVAAADGTVTRVNESNLGGRVVWFRPEGKNMSLYYAHLDEQLVQAGQSVRAGDTLGLVGNTGNARTTPPHLHFGIYTFGGAINPLPFIDRDVKEAPVFRFDTGRLNRYYRLQSEHKEGGVSLAKGTVVLATAAGPGQIQAQLPDGRIASLPQASVQVTDNQLVAKNLSDSGALLDAPRTEAGRKRALPVRQRVEVLGYFNDFALVRAEGQEGWIPRTQLR